MNRRVVFELININFSYGKKKVIDDLSLIIDSGRFYGIVGPNGCGKTTLLDLIVRNKNPDSGTIKYLGKEMSRFSRHELAREISLVPQEFYINFPFTAKEIVLMGRHPYIPRFSSPSAKDLAIVDEIMEKMEIDSLRERFVTELSGGEKQRVVFARALAQDTPVLVLDEGTSNMDIKYTLTILNTVKERVKREGRTVIAAMHNLNLAATYCDRIAFMKSGKIVSEGDADEVLNERNIKNVFGVEAKVYLEEFSNSRQVVFKR
jgi:iron complex transport system ATP-binding protein